MPKLPLLSRAHAEFNKQVSATEDQTARYVIPLFAIDEDGNRYALGSAVLIQIGSEKFLVSAAHVFDENSKQKNPSNIEIPGTNSFVPISGQVMKSALPKSGKRADDTYDIAVVKLGGNIAEQLDHHEFLDIRDVDPSDVPYLQSLYTFTGFPSTKQKMPKNGVLTIEPVRYTSGPLPPEKYPKGFALGPHHGIDFDRKKMVSRAGVIQTPPAPHGVSGGGVFRLGTFDQIRDRSNKPALVGIAIETKPGCLIATNITYALELIRADCPELDAQIPRSEYFRVNVTT